MGTLIISHFKNTSIRACHAGFIPASRFFCSNFEVAERCPQ